MKYLIDAIVWLVGFFSSSKSRFLALFPLKVSISALAIFSITAYISALISLATFLVKLFNILHTLFNSFNNSSSNISGEAYGISLSQLWNVFLGFLSASGLSVAISTSLSLFFLLLFSYLSVKLSLLVANAAKGISAKMAEIIMVVGN